MVASLQEALALLNLQPGESYRTTVNGRVIEVRALAEGKAEETPAEATEFAGQFMLNLRLDVPPSPAARTITVQRGAPLLPPPLFLDELDLAPE